MREKEIKEAIGHLIADFGTGCSLSCLSHSPKPPPDIIEVVEKVYALTKPKIQLRRLNQGEQLDVEIAFNKDAINLDFPDMLCIAQLDLTISQLKEQGYEVEVVG